MEQLNLFADDFENADNEYNKHNEQKTNAIKDIKEEKTINETVKFPGNWSITDMVNYLQRKILLNAILYYEYDKSYVTDNYYDGMSHQLVQMQKNISIMIKTKSNKKLNMVMHSLILMGTQDLIFVHV